MHQFKTGDRVRYIGPSHICHNKIGTVIEVGDVFVCVRFDGGSQGNFLPKQFELLEGIDPEPKPEKWVPNVGERVRYCGDVKTAHGIAGTVVEVCDSDTYPFCVVHDEDGKPLSHPDFTYSEGRIFMSALEPEWKVGDDVEVFDTEDGIWRRGTITHRGRPGDEYAYEVDYGNENLSLYVAWGERDVIRRPQPEPELALPPAGDEAPVSIVGYEEGETVYQVTGFQKPEFVIPAPTDPKPNYIFPLTVVSSIAVLSLYLGGVEMSATQDFVMQNLDSLLLLGGGGLAAMGAMKVKSILSGMFGSVGKTAVAALSIPPVAFAASLAAGGYALGSVIDTDPNMTALIGTSAGGTIGALATWLRNWRRESFEYKARNGVC